MGQGVNTPILCQQVPRIGNRLTYWLGSKTLSMMGWSYSGEFPNLAKMIIIIAPHTSNWDFVIGLAVTFNLRLKISFLGKHSIFFWPFNLLLRRLGGIPIERSHAHGVVGAMTAQMSDAQQMVLCLSPEGTRSAITPWKTGFLHIANKANVPVFLVAFDYKKKRIEFGPVHQIGDNVQDELNRIYRHYQNVQAKFPTKVLTTVEPDIEK